MPSIDPTAIEVLAGCHAQGGRLTLARKEMLRYLHDVVAGVVSLVNTREHGSATVGIRNPVAFYIARQPIDAKGFPAIIVGLSVGARSGPPLIKFRTVTMMVYIVDKPTTNREDADDLLDLADLVDMTTSSLQNAHSTADGVNVWNSLRFESLSQLPMSWDEYAGIGIEYTMDMSGLKNWPQT